MINEIDLMLNFTDEKYQKEFDEKVRKEQIMTMSDHFYQKSRDLGTRTTTSEIVVASSSMEGASHPSGCKAGEYRPT